MVRGHGHWLPFPFSYYASGGGETIRLLPFSSPDFIGLLMHLNVTKTGFRNLSEFMTRRGIDYTAATGHTFPRPIPTRQAFLDTWKDMAKPLQLRPPVNVHDPPASGRSWAVHS